MIETRVPGDAGAIDACAAWLRTGLQAGVTESGDCALDARRNADSDWDGDDREAYREHVRALVTATDAHAQRVGRAAGALERYAARLRRMKERMREIRTEAAGGGLVVDGTVIRPPADAPAIPADADADTRRAHQAQVARIELYDRLAGDAEQAWTSFEQWCETELAAAHRDAEESEELASLRDFVGDNLANFLAGAGITFSSGTLLQKAGEYRTRAEQLRRDRRSGHPGRRARGNAPEARSNIRSWLGKADDFTRWGKLLGPVGVAVDVAFGAWEVHTGEKGPGEFVVSTGASIAGGAAVVAGASALAAAGIVTAPVWGTALAAGAVAVGAGALASYAWDNWVPDSVTETVDEALSDAWDGATNAVSEGWDAVTGWL